MHSIHKKVDVVEQGTLQSNKLIQMTYDHIGEQKQYYIHQMKEHLQNNKKDSEILTLIRETNSTFLDKTTYALLQQFPKLTQDIKHAQKEMIQSSHQTFEKIIHQSNETTDAKVLETMIHGQYQQMTDKMMSTLQLSLIHI